MSPFGSLEQYEREHRDEGCPYGPTECPFCVTNAAMPRKDDQMTTPTADKIQGNAKENAEAAIASVARIEHALMTAYTEATSIRIQLCRGLDQDLPEAGETLKTAYARAEALCKILRTVANR